MRQWRADIKETESFIEAVQREVTSIEERLRDLAEEAKYRPLHPKKEALIKKAAQEELEEKRLEIRNYRDNIEFYEKQINEKLGEVMRAQNQSAIRLAQIKILRARLARSATELSRLQRQVGTKIPKRTFRRGLK